MKKHCSISILTICLLSSCQTVNIPPPIDHSSRAIELYLDKICPTLISYNLPGIQIAMIANGNTIYQKSFGTMNKKDENPVMDNTVFQVASISKTITAWAVLKLFEMHKIDLDEPIWEYIHRWTIKPSKFDPNEVTVRSILAHRAGLTVHGYPGYSPSKVLPTIEESLSGNNGTFFGVYRPGPVRIQSKTWSKYSYSGGGYTLLQLMIEEVTGKAFSDFVNEKIFIPLGMTHSSFEITDEVKNHLSKAYSSFGCEVPNYVFVEKAAAGLYTTASDLAIILNELYLISHEENYRSPVLKTENARLFYSENPFVKDNQDVFGYFREKEDSKIFKISHGGSNRGWKAYYGMEMENGRGIIVLTNSNMGNRAISKITSIFFNNETRFSK